MFVAPRRLRAMDNSPAIYTLSTMRLREEEAWREQCRQQLSRDVLTRIKYGFCHVDKPVLDDLPFRTFATMAEYRAWCESNLPSYLGYRRVAAS
jgi:hypothetical protein